MTKTNSKAIIILVVACILTIISILFGFAQYNLTIEIDREEMNAINYVKNGHLDAYPQYKIGDVINFWGDDKVSWRTSIKSLDGTRIEDCIVTASFSDYSEPAIVANINFNYNGSTRKITISDTTVVRYDHDGYRNDKEKEKIYNDDEGVSYVEMLFDVYGKYKK